MTVVSITKSYLYYNEQWFYEWLHLKFAIVIALLTVIGETLHDYFTYYFDISRNTILRFMKNIRSILSDAYKVRLVEDGWCKTGLMPFNQEAILGQWSFYCTIDKKEKKQLGTTMSHIAKANGYITAKEMKDHFSNLVGFYYGILLIVSEIVSFVAAFWNATYS